MTSTAWLLAILAAACAVADWNAVAREQRRAILVFKPLTLIALIAVALALRPTSELQRDLFVAALFFGLAGDVLLMLSERWFTAGLAAFLVGNLLYLAGFLAVGSLRRVGVSQLPLMMFATAVLGQVVGRLVRSRPGLALAVLAYGLALAGMAVTALANGRPAAALGGLLFVISDSVLAWNRFVRPIARAPLIVIVTYHLAQAALVYALVR